MKLRSIGILAGEGGHISSALLFQGIMRRCQQAYGCFKIPDHPCMVLYSYPHKNLNAQLSSRQVSFCLQKLIHLGVELVVIPSPLLASYLIDQSYGVSIIEPGTAIKAFLEANDIANPLVLCSERARKSGYFESFFDCRYPSSHIQRELDWLIEEAFRGEEVYLSKFLKKLPFVPIILAESVFHNQMPLKDPRLIDSNKLLVEEVVRRSLSSFYV